MSNKTLIITFDDGTEQEIVNGVEKLLFTILDIFKDFFTATVQFAEIDHQEGFEDETDLKDA